MADESMLHASKRSGGLGIESAVWFITVRLVIKQSTRRSGPAMNAVSESGRTHIKRLFKGCTKGLGKLIALEALKRGERVIATGRGDVSQLQALKNAGAHVMTCDVTVSSAEMREIAKEAEEIYGKVDVVVNNAGMFTLGPLEELGYVSSSVLGQLSDLQLSFVVFS